MGSTQIGLVSSIFTLGGLVGALFSGFLAAKYGRLLVMRVNTLLLAVGPIIEALAPNIGLLAAGRLVSGVGAGVSVVVVPIYISEIAPPKERGFFGAFTQIMTNMGIFITQLLGYFLSHGQMWRVILAVAGAIGVLQLLGLFFSVDSPTWQADHGDAREAKANLKRIRGHKADISEEVAVWRMHDDGNVDGKKFLSRYPSLPCYRILTHRMQKSKPHLWMTTTTTTRPRHSA